LEAATMGILSWSGRGLVVLPLLLVPAMLMFAFEDRGPQSAMLAFGVGWLLAGAVCLVLGKWWNADGPLHKFARLRMETWGYICLGFGLLLLIPQLIGRFWPEPQVHPRAR
jgi:hypothetical protein